MAAASGYSATCARSGAKPIDGGCAVQRFSSRGCDGERWRNLLRVSGAGVMLLDAEREQASASSCSE